MPPSRPEPLAQSGRPEATLAARRPSKIGCLDDLDRLDPRDDELGDPITRLDRERFVPIRVQEQHPQLASVARVDQPGSVYKRDPVARRETGAWQHEARMAIRDRYRNAGSDARSGSGLDPRVLRRKQVIAGVMLVRPLRRFCFVTQAREFDNQASSSSAGLPFASKRRSRSAAAAGTRA